MYCITLNPVFRASTRNAHLQKRILMRITQSTSVGGLNPDWFIDCETCEMAGSAWSVVNNFANTNKINKCTNSIATS